MNPATANSLRKEVSAWRKQLQLQEPSWYISKMEITMEELDELDRQGPPRYITPDNWNDPKPKLTVWGRIKLKVWLWRWWLSDKILERMD